MKYKRKIVTKATSILLTSVLIVSVITLLPATAQAAGWLEYAQDITLGNAVSASIKSGDYYDAASSHGSNWYWHIYKFTMPQDGLLNLYIESEVRDYVFLYANHITYGHTYGEWEIYSGANPDNLVWSTDEINYDYSSARGMHYGSIEVALNKGDYYFVMRYEDIIDASYYLTLSYKEPTINISSISLSYSSMTMEVGEQRTVNTTVLPDNATDKTIIWSSSNSSVATVSNGMVIAVSDGTATITASSLDGAITAKCNVTVLAEQNTTTQRLTVKSRNVRLKLGKVYSLNAQITPVTSSQRITYKSSKPKVATVNSKGQIKAKKIGKAVITVRSGKKTVKVKVIVKK